MLESNEEIRHLNRVNGIRGHATGAATSFRQSSRTSTANKRTFGRDSMGHCTNGLRCRVSDAIASYR
jgi:hypothetical protein